MTPKYRNIKTGGFDSRREARRWQELRLLQRAGKIRNLERQVKYELLPTQRGPDVVVNGKTKRGPVLERPVKYVADFVYIDEHGRRIVEDVKGVRTREYVIKRKLMLAVYGIQIREI